MRWDPAAGARPVHVGTAAEEEISVGKPTSGQYRDTPVDVKVRLSALWIAMLFVFAYVDLFGLYRRDVLDKALKGKMATTDFAINQVFLAAMLIYVLLPILMVVGCLVLAPRVNRTVNLAVSILYLVTVLASCVGESWTYYWLGSLVEAALLAAIGRTAWNWPVVDGGSAADSRPDRVEPGSPTADRPADDPARTG